MFHLKFVFSYLFSVFHALSISISRMLKPPTIIVLVLHSILMCVSICYMQGGASMLDT